MACHSSLAVVTCISDCLVVAQSPDENTAVAYRSPRMAGEVFEAHLRPVQDTTVLERSAPMRGTFR